MRGSQPSLHELFVNEETPDVIDLYCYEDIDQITEEEELEETMPQDTYEIVSVTNLCGICGHPIGFNVRTTRDALRTLQVLLFEELQFLCFECSQEQQQQQNDG